MPTATDRISSTWIGTEHAIELALRLLGHGPQLARPLAFDLSARLVRALGGNVREVRIERLTEGIFDVGTTESDQTVAEALAVIDSEHAVGAQALLDEMTRRGAD
jgi:bifunctional DNase/RNase